MFTEFFFFFFYTFGKNLDKVIKKCVLWSQLGRWETERGVAKLTCRTLIPVLDAPSVEWQSESAGLSLLSLFLQFDLAYWCCIMIMCSSLRLNYWQFSNSVQLNSTSVQKHTDCSLYTEVLWSSDQFRVLWYRSSFGRGASVSQSFPERDIMAPHAWETNPFHICSPTQVTCIRLRLSEAGVWREVSGKKVSSSSSWSNMSLQQLYATRPPGGCGEGVGRPSQLCDNTSTSPLQLLCLVCPCISLERVKPVYQLQGGAWSQPSYSICVFMRREGQLLKPKAEENRKREKYKTEEND